MLLRDNSYLLHYFLDSIKHSGWPCVFIVRWCFSTLLLFVFCNWSKKVNLFFKITFSLILLSLFLSNFLRPKNKMRRPAPALILNNNTAEYRYLSIFLNLRIVTKGQLISKWFFGVVNFLQKTNENKSTWGIIAV